MMRKMRNSGLNSEVEEVRSRFGGSVNRCVICEHERRKIQFPVEGVLLDYACEVFGDEFVEDLGLSITLRMVRGGGCVLDLEECIEVVGDFSGKFLAVVGDDFLREAVAANPTVEDGIADRGSFFVGKCQNFGVLVECIGDAEDVLFAGFGGAKRAEEISVYALIGGRALWQGVQDM
jgi:hypothetical protein